MLKFLKIPTRVRKVGQRIVVTQSLKILCWDRRHIAVAHDVLAHLFEAMVAMYQSLLGELIAFVVDVWII